MTALLLGSTGQVGLALRGRLAAYMDLIAPARCELDLSDKSALAHFLETQRPSLILNAAAYTAVDRAEADEELATTLNADMPGILAQYTARNGARLIHYSTDYVFDGSGTQAWQEDDKAASLNTYGKTKLMGERAIMAAKANTVIFRTSWVYSANGVNFVKTALRLASQNESIRIVDDQVGAPTCADLIADISIRAVQDKKLPGGIYHLAAQGCTSWHGFASEIIATARRIQPQRAWAPEGIIPIRSEQFPTPARRPMNSRLCCDKLDAEFDLVRPSWSEALPGVVSQILEEEYQ